MPKDIRGIEIEVGDLIAYPGRSGSSMWQTLTRVTKITTRPHTRWNYVTRQYEPDGSEDVVHGKTPRRRGYTHTARLNRVVIVEKWSDSMKKEEENNG